MLQVLYVGWDIDAVESLEGALRKRGHRLISTYKEEHGMFHVTNDNVDLAVIDYEMEGGPDCLRVVRGARAYNSDLPIVIVTQHAMTKALLRQHLRDVERVKIVRKPFQAEGVVRAIEELVQETEDVQVRRDGVVRRRITARRPSTERRRGVRRPVSMPLEYYVYEKQDMGQELHFGMVKNYSESGFLFDTLSDLDGRNQLRTALKLGGEEVYSDVEIVRTRQLPDRWEVAVRFASAN